MYIYFKRATQLWIIYFKIKQSVLSCFSGTYVNKTWNPSLEFCGFKWIPVNEKSNILCNIPSLSHLKSWQSLFRSTNIKVTCKSEFRNFCNTTVNHQRLFLQLWWAAAKVMNIRGFLFQGHLLPWRWFCLGCGCCLVRLVIGLILPPCCHPNTNSRTMQAEFTIIKGTTRRKK